MLDVLKAKKIAVIHDKDTYGQGLADATRAALAKRGTKEVLYEGAIPRREGLQRAGDQNWRAEA
ncbi:leucine ABC transporter subunit substrate-binding protein LivK [Raoultella planticola]|uniref:Leucine ABC transporter subunit substrate-binding protein LivK n=1 Tax=Raoultella planticola TaxID=575 RepID=A0A485CWT8_RAOPL|nr:leucine ABC transporter subunit substrate-binding protein LivK [Raoultella planticola]